MKTRLKSAILGDSLLSLALLICAALTARADTVDGSSIVCSPSSCTVNADGFGPGSASVGISAYCLDSSNQHSAQLYATAAMFGDLSGIYYTGNVSAAWSSAGVYASAIIYDEETYNQSYVDVAAGCDGSSSGYLEDETDVDGFYIDTLANGDGEYEAIV